MRLDRPFASADWIIKFPFVHLHHLPRSSSGHKPIWLVSDDIQSRFYHPQKPFRFKAMWIKDERCEGVVHSAWYMCFVDDPMGKVLGTVNNCQTQLQLWDKNTFGNIRILLA